MKDEMIEQKQPLLRIKEILKEKGWTIQYLADRLGVSRPYVSDILSERKGASVNSLVRIAQVLERPVSSLFADYQSGMDSVRCVCPNCGSTIDYDLSPSSFSIINASNRWDERTAEKHESITDPEKEVFKELLPLVDLPTADGLPASDDEEVKLPFD